GDEIGREQGMRTLIEGNGVWLIKPAVSGEMGANLVFESQLSMQIHGLPRVLPSPVGRGAGGEGTLRFKRGAGGEGTLRFRSRAASIWRESFLARNRARQ